MQAAEVGPRLVEVVSVLTPAPGVSLEEALRDANPQGYQKLEIIDGEAHITWFKEVDE
jgi:hypothetical protein